MFWIVYQVPALLRIGFQIVQLIDVPDAMIVNVFVTIAAKSVHRWRLWEIPFPAIIVGQRLSPGPRLALSHRDEALSIQAFRRFESRRFKNGWGNVDIRHKLTYLRAALEEVWTLTQQRPTHSIYLSG